MLKNQIEQLLDKLLEYKRISIIADINAERCGTNWDWKKANDYREKLEETYTETVENIVKMIDPEIYGN